MLKRCMIGVLKMNEELDLFCNEYKRLKELKLGKHKLKVIILEERK
jgi:hypothetical protein